MEIPPWTLTQSFVHSVEALLSPSWVSGWGWSPGGTETVSLCPHPAQFNKVNTSLIQLLGVSKCRRKQNWLEVKNMTWKVEEDVQELETPSN